MADAITPESLGFIGGFGPATPPPDVMGYQGSAAITETKREDSVTPQETKPVTNSVDNKDVKVETKPQSLADVLRADREARDSRNREANETRQAASRVKELESELAKIKSSKAFEDDPIGYLKTRNISPELQLTIGQSLLYDLAPDKAPPDLRIKLFEQKQRRDAELRENQLREEASKQELNKARSDFDQYANVLSETVKTFTPGSYPESESWFIGENDQVDYGTYNKSLLATAMNLANSAKTRGQTADLSPANVAKVLETEIAKRMAKRDAKRTPAVGNQSKTVINSTKQSGESLSTRGLNSGAPEKPANNEAERIRRAALVAFGPPA
jgi:hypothetical protein